MDIIYLRGKNPKVLRDCFYYSKYDNWVRSLSRYDGIEWLDNKKVIAEVCGHKARPEDGLEKYSNKCIQSFIKKLGFKIDKTGLFYCNGRYRTWRQRKMAQEQGDG